MLDAVFVRAHHDLDAGAARSRGLPGPGRAARSGRSISAVDVARPLVPEAGARSRGDSSALAGRRVPAGPPQGQAPSSRRRPAHGASRSRWPRRALRHERAARSSTGRPASTACCTPPVRRRTLRPLHRAASTTAGGWPSGIPAGLGGVELDPDENRLGPDALGVTAGDLRRALAGSHVALKARLLDQARLAGVGNLIADEVLWRAGLAPGRPCDSLDAGRAAPPSPPPVGGPGRADRARGVPHGRPGAAAPPRRAVPARPHPAQRGTVGGRTTWWCPHHQR